MTMNDPPPAERTGAATVQWLEDQLSQLKALIGRIQQQGEQTQAAIVDMNDKLRDQEGRLREVTSKTGGLPMMHEQLRQLSGVLERIQDAEVLIDTRFEILDRTSSEERTREQSEKNDMHRRIQELERRAEGLAERQSSVDDANRRFQDEISRSHLHYQGLNQRLESVESKAARSVDAVTRAEQAHAEAEQAIRSLRREDEALAERARLAHEVASRIELEMHTTKEELRELPLLAERVELLRAERQRLEDRTSRLEGSLEDARTRLEREEEISKQVDVRLKAHEGRIDQMHASTLEYRRSISEHVLKLNQMLERMKRREVEELERQVKELRVQSNQLKSEDE